MKIKFFHYIAQCEIANTRIDNGGTRLYDDGSGNIRFFGGARNPDPTYYQNLPSYQLRFENLTPYNYQQAFLAQRDFVNDGQWDWNSLYEANANLRAQGYNSLYAVQADVNKDSQFSVNTILDANLAENIRLNAAINYRALRSENFARVEDLLGGTGYLDVDFFADEEANSIDQEVAGNLAQSDLQNPNRIVTEGDRYKYNYELDADVISGFAQAQFKYNKVDFYVGAHISQTSYQRNGLFENGFFAGGGNFGSLGKSDKLEFSNYGVKGGFTYKITGRHLIDVNGSYFTKAPGMRNSFSNARQTNAKVVGLESEKIQSVDMSYIFRSPLFKARITGFYSGFQDGSDIGFYFTEDLVLLNFSLRLRNNTIGLPTKDITAAMAMYTITDWILYRK